MASQRWSPVSGMQYELAHDDQRAVITEVGATLRSYEVADEPVILGFGLNEIPSGGRGQILAPWPNRLSGGGFDVGGRHGQAPLDSPDHTGASHGLVRWQPWRLLVHRPERVRLVLTCHVQPAYPFCLEFEVEYRLGPEGLSVSTTVTNRGDVPAPFGLGFHGYLHPGAETLNGCTLELPAREQELLDDDMMPLGRAPIESSAFARLWPGPSAAELGNLAINHCFTSLVTDGEGRWHARLRRPAGRRDLGLWADAAFGYAMVYTGDNMEPRLRRRGIAVEPMTCPPNALLTGESLIVLRPLEQAMMSWGIAAH